MPFETRRNFLAVPLMSRFPTVADYVLAVQQPSTFLRPELVRAVFDRDSVWGIPIPRTGVAAVVFKAEVDGIVRALRFFLRSDASMRDRYTALNSYFHAHGLAMSVAACEWLDNAIELNGDSWPLVQMQWVEGPSLDVYVGNMVERGETDALAALAADWRKLIWTMQAAQFAHGDLQHGNVLIDSSGRLRLVDFDCVWLPGIATKSPPTEVGHANYQRLDRPWGPLMDTFPGLVIYASLLALARDHDFWGFHQGENLIFCEADFKAPGETPVWHRAARIDDPMVQRVMSRLRQCCACEWSPSGVMESLLDGTGEPGW